VQRGRRERLKGLAELDAGAEVGGERLGFDKRFQELAGGQGNGRRSDLGCGERSGVRGDRGERGRAGVDALKLAELPLPVEQPCGVPHPLGLEYTIRAVTCSFP
jgi:hypothetical protein